MSRRCPWVVGAVGVEGGSGEVVLVGGRERMGGQCVWWRGLVRWRVGGRRGVVSVVGGALSCGKVGVGGAWGFPGIGLGVGSVGVSLGWGWGFGVVGPWEAVGLKWSREC